MECVDSRRLTGPNLQWDRPGAVIEVNLSPADTAAAIRLWERCARAMLDAVGWSEEGTSVRRYSGGASLAISAPIDALYAACEVNEAAWSLAVAELTGADTDPEGQRRVLAALIEEERNPALLRLSAAADVHGVTFLSDDESVSIGLGSGSQVWPVDDLPTPEALDWSGIHDVPVGLVTGTNGKTTTVRMLSAIALAAGLVPANTSTDGVQIAGETVLPGDYTGPEGARALLRDSRVELAFLETARGGLLRRGLPLPRADAACVTNIGHDHFGEYGIDSLEAVAAVKLIVARGVAPGAIILNADDPVLVAAARQRELSPVWVSGIGGRPEAARPEETVWGLTGDWLGHWEGDVWTPLMRIAEISSAHGGAAHHNVYNALSAAAMATQMDLPGDAIVAGLERFSSDFASNPGRGNMVELGGCRAWIDFAHNPEGLRAILSMARSVGAKRTLLILGQAGDRDDASIDALGDIAAAARPDRIILKEMPRYLRGRSEGEVTGRLLARLQAGGFPHDMLESQSTEMGAVRAALTWARPGDLLLLLLHAERDAALHLVSSLRAAEWSVGTPLPRIEEG